MLKFQVELTEPVIENPRLMLRIQVGSFKKRFHKGVFTSGFDIPPYGFSSCYLALHSDATQAVAGNKTSLYSASRPVASYSY